MRVLYIIDYKTVGGATHSFIEMVSQMKELGIEPVVCLGRNTDITIQLEQKGIAFFCAGHRTVLEPVSRRMLRRPLAYMGKALYYYFKEMVAKYKLSKIDCNSFDIIHTNSARNDIGCYINKKYGLPHVMHIREFSDIDFDCVTFRPNYIRLFNKYTTRFISISNAVKQHWTNKGIQKDKISIIYNGIHFDNITISEDKDKLSSFHMVIVGGVVPVKGQHIAVDAIGYLPESVRNNITLDVIGWFDKGYVDKMKDDANTRGYGERIHFWGALTDVHERLGNYQIGLMCSKAEGFGRVTAEYMHAQLGIIASDSGANSELIQNGVNGLLFKSGDAKSLADCILMLYNDRHLLIRLSHAAKDKARKVYTQKRNADEILRIYQELLKK